MPSPRVAVMRSLVGEGGVAAYGYSEVRFRHRVHLVMGDRTLQKAYWKSHVSRRRVPVKFVLRAGIERGILRDDLDVESCFDAIAGVACCQLVVRGDHLDEPQPQSRVNAAPDVIWRGCSPDSFARLD